MATIDHDRILSLERDLHTCRRRLDDFVSTISHELRTPITSIRGSLGLLTSGSAGDLSAEASELLAMAERNSVRLVEMMNDIVDLHRLETGLAELHLNSVSLDRLVSQAVHAVEKVAAERDVTLDVASSDADVSVDSTRVQHAVRHLIANALKVSPAGSTVRVQGEADEAWVTIKVIDRGRGIPSANQAAMFDRYRQSPGAEARPKKGLGLAITRAIAERHGGSVGVESEEGKGSTFWIRLPATPTPRGPDPPVPAD